MNTKCTKCQVYNKSCKRCYDRTRYVRLREKILARNSAWAKSHKDVVNKHNKRWREKNQVWIKNWHKKNRKKINKYYRTKLQSNPHLRVSANISRNIAYSLKNGKSGLHWEILVGYTRQQLVAHIESLFLPNMTWKNYGAWHIDHVIPKSHFNITSHECVDFKKCWALSNLQPLWESDNCSKGNRFIG
jgi:hypothetical protein